MYFEIGENNIRSQKALKRFGVEEIERSEQGLKKGNLEFRLTREAFRERPLRVKAGLGSIAQFGLWEAQLNGRTINSMRGREDVESDS